MMNKITGYKGRKINYNQPVYLYRNLNKKGVVYSLRQNNLVVGHATDVNLLNCQFIVNEKSRDKVRRTGRKVVHAFIRGFVFPLSPKTDARVMYNPKKTDGFIRLDNHEIVQEAKWARCDEIMKTRIESNNYLNGQILTGQISEKEANEIMTTVGDLEFDKEYNGFSWMGINKKGEWQVHFARKQA